MGQMPPDSPGGAHRVYEPLMPWMNVRCWQTGSGTDLNLTIQESLEGLSQCCVEEEVWCVRYQYQGYQAMRFYRLGRLCYAPATSLYRPCGNHGRSKEGCASHLSLRIPQDR
jgi:hypothetical protein